MVMKSLACQHLADGGRGRQPSAAQRSGLMRLIIAALTGALLLVACSRQDPQQQAQALLGAARQAMEKGDSAAAQIHLKGALQAAPDMAEARFLLGRSLLDSGRPADAAVELRKALALKHPAEQAVPALARALLAQGEGRLLLTEHGSTVLEDANAQADLKTSLAQAWFQAGDNRRGDATLAEALAAAPMLPAARMLQARRLAGSGQLDAALATLAELLEANPREAQAWSLRGDLLSISPSHRAEAVPAYEKAVALEPRLLAAHVGLLSELIARPDVAAAGVALARLKKALPEHPKVSYFEAVLALQHHELKAARQLSDKLQRQEPTNPDYMRLAGTVALAEGDVRKAVGLLAQALRQAPDNTMVRRLLAGAQLQAAQPGQALATLTPLLEKGVADVMVLRLAAAAHAQLGDFGRSAAMYESAARVQAPDERTRAATAFARWQHNEDPRALAELQALASSGADTAADLALINTWIQRKAYDRAAAAIDALQRKQPGQPLAEMLRGRLALLRNDEVQARAAFERAAALSPTYFPACAALAAMELRAQQRPAAQQRFRAFLQRDPDNLDALVALAGLLEQATVADAEVQRLLGRAIELAPGKASIRVLLVNHHLQARDAKRAVQVARDGVAALPGDPQMLDALGRAHLAAGDANQALTAFNQLSTAMPASAHAQLNLARASLALKDGAAARLHLKRALQAQPDFVPARMALIELELSEQRGAEALALAKELQAQRPRDPVGLMAEGQVRGAQKQWDAATRAYRGALALGTDRTDVAVRLHDVLLAAGRHDEAAQFAANWQQAHPRDAAFLSYLGDVALRRRDLPLAERQFRALLALQPQNAPALNNVAWVLLEQGKPGALAYAEQANALRPDQPGLMDTMAMALAADKQLAKAIAVQQRAVAMRPDDAGLRATLTRLQAMPGAATAAR